VRLSLDRTRWASVTRQENRVRGGFTRKMKMGSKTYLVRFKNPAISTQPVVASRAEIRGDHIVMLDSEDRLVALFWMSIVESWSEIPRLAAAC
jgi:hypothetical protein